MLLQPNSSQSNQSVKPIQIRNERYHLRIQLQQNEKYSQSIYFNLWTFIPRIKYFKKYLGVDDFPFQLKMLDLSPYELYQYYSNKINSHQQNYIVNCSDGSINYQQTIKHASKDIVKNVRIMLDQIDLKKQILAQKLIDEIRNNIQLIKYEDSNVPPLSLTSVSKQRFNINANKINNIHINSRLHDLKYGIQKLNKSLGEHEITSYIWQRSICQSINMNFEYIKQIVSSVDYQKLTKKTITRSQSVQKWNKADKSNSQESKSQSSQIIYKNNKSILLNRRGNRRGIHRRINRQNNLINEARKLRSFQIQRQNKLRLKKKQEQQNKSSQSQSSSSSFSSSSSSSSSQSFSSSQSSSSNEVASDQKKNKKIMQQQSQNKLKLFQKRTKKNNFIIQKNKFLRIKAQIPNYLNQCAVQHIMSFDHENSFKIKIIKSVSSDILVGCLDRSLAQSSQTRKAYAYYGKTRTVIYDSSVKQMGTGFKQKDIVQVKINKQRISWIVNGTIQAYYSDKRFGESIKKYVPFLQINSLGDIIQWIPI